jgi:hypothetical protein
MRRFPIWLMAAALLVAATTARAESDDKRMCKQGCEEELTNCKSGCQVERDSGDQEETDRYRGCDAQCHDEYNDCKSDCSSK